VSAPSREEALATLAEGQSAIEALIAGLTEAEMCRPGTIGGGWSAKDLLGHLAFWEELASQALAEWSERRRPSVIAIFERGGDGVDEANARNQEQTAAQTLDQVRARAAAAHAAIVAIRAMPDARWQEAPFYPDRHHPTLADLLGGILGAPGRPFGHAFAHRPDLEAYVASLGGGGRQG
jgi:hypothetical protein